MQKQNIRILALQQLKRLFVEHESLAYIAVSVSPSDKPYFQELCFGVARFYDRLSFILAALTKKPLRAKEIEVKLILLIALYELFYSNTAEHAVVSEAVNAIKVLKKEWATGFVNALLRRAAREKEQLLKKIETDEIALYAHPEWLIKKFKKDYPNEWQSILIANNERPPMTLRVNQQKISRDDYLKKLHHAATPTHFSSSGLILNEPLSVEALPGFAEGEVSVQDESPQLAAMLLDLKSGQRVLDACAAPGGKTAHILERCPDLDELVAIDISEKRMQRVEENLNRLHLSATLKVADLLTYKENGQYDRILLDAPCSATGVIRRHPDIKHLRTRDEIVQLAETQLKLLQSLWPLLKNGGCLLYATCSLFPEENEEVIARFLQITKDASEMPITLSWGLPRQHGRQHLPGENHADGFYYAMLCRSAF